MSRPRLDRRRRFDECSQCRLNPCGSQASLDVRAFHVCAKREPCPQFCDRGDPIWTAIRKRHSRPAAAVNRSALSEALRAKRRNLARLALPDTSTPMAKIDFVELEGPKDGTLSLKLLAPAASGRGGPSELGRRQRRQGEDFVCEQAWLVPSKTKIAPLSASVVKDAARLTRQASGYFC